MDDIPSRLQHWDTAVRVPLAVLGIVFIAGFSVMVLVPTLLFLALCAVILTWVGFAIDYIVCIALTPHGRRWAYVLRHPLQLLAVLLPIFRAVRVVDLIRKNSFHRRTGTVIRTKIVTYLTAYSIVFMYLITLSTLFVERSAKGATITNFGNATWWAFVTLTTVGYGDVYPVTMLGRFYAILLMMGGIVIIGVTSGTIVSYISERIRDYNHNDIGS